MDTVTIIAPAVGAAVGGGLVIAKSWIDRWLGRKEKAEDREHARDERHHERLSGAYAELLAAYSKFLNLSDVRISRAQALQRQQQTAHDEVSRLGGSALDEQRVLEMAGIPALVERVGDLTNAMADAWTEVDIKAVAVRLLDHDRGRAERVRALANLQLPPLYSADNFDRFQEDLRRMRHQLGEFSASLDGAFSNIAERRTLEHVKPAAALPEKTTR